MTAGNHAAFDILASFTLPDGGKGSFHRLADLQKYGFSNISRLPVSIRVLLEAAIRKCDGQKVTEQHIEELAGWQPKGQRLSEVPLVPARILLQDLNGVPIIADLAAMRDAAVELGQDPSVIEPLVHVDMVIDHSVQVDSVRKPSALADNMRLEYERNAERYRFLKWGAQAFEGLNVIPPGVGICHQVNLERLATGVCEEKGIYFFDTVVCPDSHTTMINGIGILGWGVGGIEAEAGMLGQPVYFLTPDVTGVELIGEVPTGVTSTDIVLSITERLRQERVVGDFVEFFGEGAAALTVPTRTTIANMAPEYGAFIGFFPMDEAVLQYFRDTNRPTDVLEAYMNAQGILGIPKAGDIDYSRVITVDLSAIVPSIAGPRRPQDRISLNASRSRFDELLSSPAASGGYAVPDDEMAKRVAIELGNGATTEIGHGDVLIAAITSCTNTSNPAAMVAAGLLARKARQYGLEVAPHIKTSMAPGSRAVTDYMDKADLLTPLSELGFDVVAYGCTTCIGFSGPLNTAIEQALDNEKLIGAAVLSGNRNFEARVHGSIKSNFLASPALVVAFAIAGTMRIDLSTQPLGRSSSGQDVYLRDIWPTEEEVDEVVRTYVSRASFEATASISSGGPEWDELSSGDGKIYGWPESMYLARPPFYDDFSIDPVPPREIAGARALAIFGDSLTTDHISPAGEIRADTPAGEFLQKQGVEKNDFNSYGSRRGNHEIMMRGTFANRRIKNLMFPPRNDGTREEGGRTIYWPKSGQAETRSIYDTATSYQREGTPVVVFGGEEYGTGSARDWAAKGTRLLGVDAVIVASFERIHRSNLVLLGVLPLEFEQGFNVQGLQIGGSETFEVQGIDGELTPQQKATLVITRTDGSRAEAPLRVRLDTPIEVEYYRHGGIVPFVLRNIFKGEH
ncbi:aconitate hydratase AcnA [Agrobacterium larrymoorei]|uniref:Aconitate hydratase n=1 Tax=Agrobacterium larrymoorei TaxID=160699 RepID=A0AAF0KG55_9HYPH|nr:aconitate hydratase AcnA [Agrobacterium larrymoorei]WHA44008.1 aconitate hydratase AcnA [Agrobacterium larrymoorei]